MINDYALTFPYGALLVLGGMMGYAKKGSTASLAGGLTTGLLLLLAGFLSRQAYYRHKNSYFALVLQTGCCCCTVMGHGPPVPGHSLDDACRCCLYYQPCDDEILHLHGRHWWQPDSGEGRLA